MPGPLSLLWVLFVVAAVVAVLVLAAASLGRFRRSKDAGTKAATYRYTAHPALLTAAERAFFSVLKLAVAERFLIFSKVNLADIITPETGTSAQTTTARNKIDRKHTDFVLCDPVTTRPVLVIELDDRSHEGARQRGRDAVKDAALGSAGVLLLRVKVSGAYSPLQLVRDIDEAVRKTGKDPVKV